MTLRSPVAQEFQPTSPRGGRLIRKDSTAFWGYFNPRPHAGDDGAAGGHAGLYPDFNPRPHAGDDRGSGFAIAPPSLFQPTSPRGGRRRVPRRRCQVGRYFNPRPHAGDDRGWRATADRHRDFNPRPHAGDDCTNHQKQRNYSSAYPIFSVHCAKQTIKNPILLFLCVPQFPQL